MMISSFDTAGVLSELSDQASDFGHEIKGIAASLEYYAEHVDLAMAADDDDDTEIDLDEAKEALRMVLAGLSEDAKTLSKLGNTMVT